MCPFPLLCSRTFGELFVESTLVLGVFARMHVFFGEADFLFGNVMEIHALGFVAGLATKEGGTVLGRSE